MKNRELANNFSNGETEGDGSNMFIEDEAIFSYGRHFPLAVRLSGGKYLVNSDNYSTSTSKHQSYVESALVGEECCYAETKVLQEAIRTGAKDVIVTQHTINPESFNELRTVIISFLKEHGFGRRAHTRSKKFIRDMKRLAITENGFDLDGVKHAVNPRSSDTYCSYPVTAHSFELELSGYSRFNELNSWDVVDVADATCETCIREYEEIVRQEKRDTLVRKL